MHVLLFAKTMKVGGTKIVYLSVTLTTECSCDNKRAIKEAQEDEEVGGH